MGGDTRGGVGTRSADAFIGLMPYRVKAPRVSVPQMNKQKHSKTKRSAKSVEFIMNGLGLGNGLQGLGPLGLSFKVRASMYSQSLNNESKYKSLKVYKDCVLDP